MHFVLAPGDRLDRKSLAQAWNTRNSSRTWLRKLIFILNAQKRLQVPRRKLTWTFYHSTIYPCLFRSGVVLWDCVPHTEIMILFKFASFPWVRSSIEIYCRKKTFRDHSWSQPRLRPDNVTKIAMRNWIVEDWQFSRKRTQISSHISHPETGNLIAKITQFKVK